MFTGTWFNPPTAVEQRPGELAVTAVEGSDFWRETLYGFTRDSGHALLTPVLPEGALEVDLRLDFDKLYDQAGLLLRTDEAAWLKAGVEISDGVPHVGAVVTNGRSDWSLAPVPGWAGTVITIRASWSAGAVTLRARADGGPWRTLRVSPFTVAGGTAAGPYLCSPERAGLTVTFTGLRRGRPDTGLHEDPPAG